MKMPKAWYQFKNEAASPTVAEIHIIDFIGDWYDEFYKQFGYETGVTAKSFVDELAELPASVATIKVYINSPGGDVFGGLNIANALREQAMSKGRIVEVTVTGVAASIASVIAMAGSKVIMADNALMMVHQPWSFAVGNAAEMRKQAETLDTITTSLVATYQWHSALSTDAITALLTAETWMTADDAIANGFATEKIEGLKAAASINPRALATLKVPEQFRARVQAFLAPADEVKVVTCDCASDCPCQNGGVCGENCSTCKDGCSCTATDGGAKNLKTPPAAPAPKAATVAEVVGACKAAGFDSLDVAAELLDAGATLEQATARVTEIQAARTAAASRATEIRALCANAKLPEMADGYVNGGMTPADVRVHLTTVTAKLDVARIDAGLSLDEHRKVSSKSALSAADIYAARNAARTGATTKEK